ncbi:MAG TPA: bifunctional DNA-formamidopyrimidine glycosylase/DNA-(apurinic or apyrimidinic site) lyase [Stellaceae bacterium]|jgi:formamidopyrimidine-DNA glycosylase|nr:bifunctional DNA-formamidopyrimidine glycosylase/DNA-(apurinic or apyrimidinic site) lyase [Stellaceae bacterium]
MPELPEVETVVRGLARALTGKRLERLHLSRPDLRSAIPPGLAAHIAGRRIERFFRRAKYILMHFEGAKSSEGGVVIAHLGMSGRLIIVPPGNDTPREKHDHAVFHFDDGTELRFNDARRFGLLDYAEAEHLAEHPLFRHLGPEPLGNEFNGPALAESLRGKKTPIKSALLDQRVVAGIGNIYACEALYGAGISPKRLAKAVQGERAEKLAAAIHNVLTRAIAAGGSSLRDYVQTSGELGYFQHQWAVYGKEGERCPGCDCKSSIRRLVQSGRSTFYCAKRQK